MRAQKSQRVEKGKPAPFSGTILDDHALAKLITDAEKQLKLCGVNADRQAKEHAVRLEATKRVCEAKTLEAELKLKACEADSERQGKLYRQELALCRKSPPFWKSGVFGFVVGQLVMGGVCIGLDRAGR